MNSSKLFSMPQRLRYKKAMSPGGDIGFEHIGEKLIELPADDVLEAHASEHRAASGRGDKFVCDDSGVDGIVALKGRHADDAEHEVFLGAGAAAARIQNAFDAHTHPAGIGKFAAQTLVITLREQREDRREERSANRAGVGS